MNPPAPSTAQQPHLEDTIETTCTETKINGLENAAVKLSTMAYTTPDSVITVLREAIGETFVLENFPSRWRRNWQT